MPLFPDFLDGQPVLMRDSGSRVPGKFARQDKTGKRKSPRQCAFLTGIFEIGDIATVLLV
jgi:hypothetical protein